MNLVISEPITGLCALPDASGYVRIFDEKGRLYYYKLAERATYLNIRQGNYFTECKVQRTKPIEYVCPPLPKPEKPSKNVFPDIELEIDRNPNKASVNIGTGHIKLDPMFLEKPLPFITFVLFHELSHNKYFTEWKCDINAAHEMLQRGYNPTQCYYANFYCLSSKQAPRKEMLLKFLSKVKTK